MAETILLEFEASVDLYTAVNALLGLDMASGDGDWPVGLISHVGSSGSGKLVVFEVWESQAHQQAFMDNRLGPALHEAGAPQPDRVEWFHTEGHYHQ
jgi:hypothetical protein